MSKVKPVPKNKPYSCIMDKNFSTIKLRGDLYAIVFPYMDDDAVSIEDLMNFLNSKTYTTEACPNFAKHLSCNHVSQQRRFCGIEPCRTPVRL